MSLKLLLNDISKYNPKANLALIEKAYRFAETCHAGQKRESGQLYFTHPLEVAKILSRMKADSATIAAGLLHDTMEECNIKLETIAHEFGSEVSELVEGVTKIDKIHFQDKEDYTAENLRKIILATAKDVRVMLIKLADRLHNMETLRTFREEKQRRIAQETLDIYAPIAHKLGMRAIKGELEDLSLRVLDPTNYRLLANKIQQRREEREHKTKRLIKQIRAALREKGIDASVQGRAKYFYSIYKKMKKRSVDFNEIYDLTAIRIITKTIPECYTALGVVHELFKPLPGRFKDYIALPKSNGYQSLHTTVVESESKILEIQIRTEEMHNIAEDGIAAHWRYKQTERDKGFDKKIGWLKQVLDWKASSKDAREFIETLKTDLFEDEVVVFTPKGDPISLPEGSTPVDFAYEVHSNLGHKCSKAMVNNKLVTLDYKLKSGDLVEIIVKKDAEPSRQWLNFVKTNRAKGKIRSYLKIEGDTSLKSGAVSLSEEKLSSLIRVDSKKNVLKIAKCCEPHPNDKIVAFPTKDKKLTVHKADCETVKGLDKRKLLLAYWQLPEKKDIKLSITMLDRVGILSEVLNVISRYKANISSVHTKAGREKFFIADISIESSDQEHLPTIIFEIRKIKDVTEVHNS
ncbi:MAG: bifunctional (p)ppGpp synthetase/guanosine-3',5'-bis(diphosphate) 3'-pyrophosphohydrolase [Candidatus Woesearchaeota archaeon]